MSRIPSIASPSGGGTLMVAWRLGGRPTLVVGGGPIAAGRARLLLEADAAVTVIAPHVNAELEHRAAREEITWHRRPFAASDLEGVAVVLCASDDATLAREVSQAARDAGVPVNVADAPGLSDFAMPATHRVGPLRMALSSGGLAPSLMGRLVRALGARVPAHAVEAVRRFGDLRARLRQSEGQGRKARRVWLRHVGERWTFEALASLGEAGVDALGRRFDGGEPPPDGPPDESDAKGEHGSGLITLVGAGPGDPRLLTRAAEEAIARADLVVADRLVPSAIVDLVPGELRMAEKFPGRSERAQREITAWVVEAARAGKRVVRLKAGDAFLFGRAGEELQAYAAQDLQVAMIPGVSSALAAPVQAGIPTTRRAVADRVLILTGQGADGAEPELPAFREDTTILLLMAVGRLEAITTQMLERGYPAQWPAAVVEQASMPGERILRAPLADLAAEARRARVRAPAVVILGRVAGETAPLDDRRQDAG